MNTTTRNRLLAIGLILAGGAALAVIAFGGIGENLVYYWTPGQMLAQGEKAYGPTIRLGGIVQKGSIKNEGTKVLFRVADGKEDGALSVPVDCSQTPPQMFREGIGVVVEGRFDKSGTFRTSRLMVNHSNEYRPPKEGEKPEDFIKSATDEPTAAAVPRAP
jgi:cytochrome c-type biogenesis protein CcmE